MGVKTREWVPVNNSDCLRQVQRHTDDQQQTEPQIYNRQSCNPGQLTRKSAMHPRIPSIYLCWCFRGRLLFVFMKMDRVGNTWCTTFLPPLCLLLSDCSDGRHHLVVRWLTATQSPQVTSTGETVSSPLSQSSKHDGARVFLQLRRNMRHVSTWNTTYLHLKYLNLEKSNPCSTVIY